jgi:DNA processing protein
MIEERSPPSTAELLAWLRLGHTHGIGAVRGRALLEHLGPPEAILEAGPAQVAQVLGSAELARGLFQSDPVRDKRIAAALRWLRQGDPEGGAPLRLILTLADPRYPSRLLDLADPPLVLYCIGDWQWLDRPQVAIVGSRNASLHGAGTARALGAAIAAAGWTVTSGLAEGIDQAAHRGALDARGGSTVAALGTGIAQVYPARAGDLARRIAASGTLISEQPLGTPPVPANFPRRNRLIAALARAVLVVEAAPRSGSLITARLAADIGREVMAVPGSIHSPLARGCNALIRQGAKLVDCAEDILAELPPISRLGLRWPPGTTPMAGSPVPGTASPAYQSSGKPTTAGANPTTGRGPPQDVTGGLAEEQARLLAVMSADPVMLETIAQRQRLPLSAALAALQTLELIGLVQRQLDGSYVRCP